MEASWSRIGPHSYRIEDGIVLWSPRGTILPDHAQQICDVMIEQHRKRGFALMLCDGGNMQPLSAEARHIYVETVRIHRLDLCLAVYGAPLLVRTTQTLVARAAAVLNQMPVMLRHFSTEAEARAFLNVEKQRRSGSGNKN